ncbi:unnamed protein product [Chrysoparadoxa australica]
MGGSYSAPKVKSSVYPSFVSGMPSLTDKVVVVTGCTSGTGFIAARTVAEKGGEVVMLNRKSERAEKALKDITEGVSGAKVVQIDCDLMDLEAVAAAAAEIKTKYGAKGVDVLVNNAGIMAMPDKRTKDGFDTQMQTNHISHFLLTKELMPLLEKAAAKNGSARVVNHSSIASLGKAPLEAKYFEKSEEGTLGGNKVSMGFQGPPWDRYHASKLANVVFTRALADKLAAKSSPVISVVAHPGLSATNLQVATSKEGGMGGLFTRILMCNAQSPEDGTVGLLTCIASPDVKNGEFWGPTMVSMRKSLAGPPVSNPMSTSEFWDREESKKMLWEKSEAAIGSTFAL